MPYEFNLRCRKCGKQCRCKSHSKTDANAKDYICPECLEILNKAAEHNADVRWAGKMVDAILRDLP